MDKVDPAAERRYHQYHEACRLLISRAQTPDELALICGCDRLPPSLKRRASRKLTYLSNGARKEAARRSRALMRSAEWLA